MILAHTFKLLGLFLSLSIFASAAPVDTDIDIMASSPAVLFRRVPQKQKRKCPHPSVWIYRDCDPVRGPRAWHDVCSYGGDRPAYAHVPNQCPKDHECVPVPADDDGDRGIVCVKDDDSDDSPKRKKQKVDEAQTGTSKLVTAGPGNKNYEKDLDIVINYDMKDASVWAEFFNTALSWIVAPNNIIVGKIQGTEITVCKGDKSDPVKARTCYPTGTYDLKQGEKINLTYGLSNGQSGYLHYAVIPKAALIHDELR